jgi:hypothetical protein
VFPSSNDEFLAIREHARILGFPYGEGPQPFADQMAWLKALIAWAARRQDVQLIVRLHPRMGVGPRHLEAATEAQTWRTQLSNLPANVAAVWPESPLSSYNLAELADVALIAWSNIGLELARFGIPVVAAFSGIGIFPTGRFIDWAATSKEYFATVEAARNREATVLSIEQAFRWTHFLHYSPLVDVSDVIPDAHFHRVPPPRLAKNARDIIDVVARGEDLSSLNMSRLPHTRAASESERDALFGAIEQFILFFMSGENVRFERRLIVNSAAYQPSRESPAKPDTPVLFFGEDGVTTLHWRGQTFKRRTPLVQRLGSLVMCARESAALHTERDVVAGVT